MAWEGKAFWTGVGWLVGGPVGGIIGAIIGAGVDEENESAEAQRQAAARAAAEKQARREQLLFESLFSMAAKMAKADGVVGKEEIDLLTALMKENMELGPDRQKEAIRIFTNAKNSNAPIEDYARRFYTEYGNEAENLQNMLLLMFYVAAADGVLHPNEERLLLTISQVFRISTEDFKALRAQFFGDTDQWYAILNCSPNDDDETIKKQYRKLVMEHHPDRLASMNLSAAAMAEANSKLQQINEAYEEIRKMRGK